MARTKTSKRRASTKRTNRKSTKWALLKKPFSSKKALLVSFVVLFALVAGGVFLWDAFAGTSRDVRVENDQYIRIVGHRKSKGRSAPIKSYCLDKIAKEWSYYMASKQTFRHSSNLGSKTTSNCGNWSKVGENIGRGSTKSGPIFKGFINSTAHRENIEDSAYTHVGIGAYRDSNNKLWITQIFARCASNCNVSKWGHKAKLTVRTSGLPSGSVANFTTIDRTGTGRHSVGSCGHSFGVKGARNCYSSYQYGLGWHDHGSGKRSGTLILAPARVDGYTFIGWERKNKTPLVSRSVESDAARLSYWNDLGSKSHCNSRTVSISCVNIPNGFHGELTAKYSREKGRLTIKTSGLPSGKTVTFKTEGHGAGYCGTSFSVTNARTCTASAGNGIGWHDHGSGYRGGIVVRAPGVSGFRFVGWSGHNGDSTDQNRHCRSLASSERCVNVPPGSSSTITAKYVRR